MKKKSITKTKPKTVIHTSNFATKSLSTNKDFRTLGLVFLLVVISFFAGYLWNRVKTLEKNQAAYPQVTNLPQQPPTRPTELKVAKPSSKDQWRGNKQARFVWVEYSDMECPFCKRIHPDLVKIVDEYKGKVAWVFRHFPLQFHQKAQKSAEALECANEIGGENSFWSMNDVIFEKMPDLEISGLSDLAGSIGLDPVAFQTCLDSGKYANQVKTEMEEGQKAGVQATPTGVIYDMKTGKTKLVEGALPYDALKAEIDAFIKQQEG